MRVDERTAAHKGKAAEQAEVPHLEEVRRRIEAVHRSEREFNKVVDAPHLKHKRPDADRLEDGLINFIEGYGLEECVHDLARVELLGLYLGYRPPTAEEVTALYVLREILERIRRIKLAADHDLEQLQKELEGQGRRRRGVADPRHDAEEDLIKCIERWEYPVVLAALRLIEKRVLFCRDTPNEEEDLGVILFYRELIDMLAALTAARMAEA